MALAAILAAALSACGGHAATAAPDPCVVMSADDIGAAAGTSMRISPIGNRQLANGGVTTRGCTYLSASLADNIMIRVEFRTGTKAIDSFKASQTAKVVNLSAQNGPAPARSVEHIASLPDPAVVWGNQLSFEDRAIVVTVVGETSNQPDPALSRVVAPVVARRLATARR